MKIKTPEELAQSETNGKRAVTLYLDKRLLNELKTHADKAGLSISRLVNESIYTYLRALKKRKK